MKTKHAISTESTKDLINIHNFLAAIGMNEDGNISSFNLSLLIYSELQERKDAKSYIDAMTKLLNVPTYEKTPE